MIKEIKIPEKEKLEHDGVKSLNKTVKRFKSDNRIFEIDLLTDAKTYDIFEVTNGNEVVIESGVSTLKDAINFLKEEF